LSNWGTCPSMTTTVPALGSMGNCLSRSWHNKLIRVGYFPPQATRSQRGGPSSPSREFRFALHQIQQAIEPHLSLQQRLCSWNQIAKALAEKSRNRLLQMAFLVLPFRQWEPFRVVILVP
jgi:hypothetical protein